MMGGGARYYLFYLYFLLGDNRRSSEYIRWFEKEFSDDSGDPFQLICWALMLHRMGKGGEFQLARTMLSNIYLLPHLLGADIDKTDMSHSSNWSEPNFTKYIPEQIQEAITDNNLVWIRAKYESDDFQAILKRHIEISHELESTPVGNRRSDLVHELYELPHIIEKL